VTYTPGSEALDIEISSKVEYLYGEAIHQAALRVVAAYGVESGTLALADQGALEWVILARIECCLRRAGFHGTPVLEPRLEQMRGEPRRYRARRSRLYVPGNQPKLMLSVGLYGADAIILDLEDSVPLAEKDAARILVRNALLVQDFADSEIMVRLNQGELGAEDARAIVGTGVHMLLLPKVETAAEVVGFGDLVRSLAGDAPPPLLMPILESPRGIANAYEIAQADPLVAALTLGLEDLSAELGAPRTSDAVESLLARQTTVYAARAAGVQPIASVYSNLDDEQGLASYVRRERGLGFDGVGCIHPRQIPIIHREMTPDAAEVERALAIVRAAREAEAQGKGVVALGAKMIDPPVVKQACRMVELAVAAGLLAPEWEKNL